MTLSAEESAGATPPPSDVTAGDVTAAMPVGAGPVRGGGATAAPRRLYGEIYIKYR